MVVRKGSECNKKNLMARQNNPRPKDYCRGRISEDSGKFSKKFVEFESWFESYCTYKKEPSRSLSPHPFKVLGLKIAAPELPVVVKRLFMLQLS